VLDEVQITRPVMEIAAITRLATMRRRESAMAAGSFFDDDGLGPR